MVLDSWPESRDAEIDKVGIQVSGGGTCRTASEPPWQIAGTVIQLVTLVPDTDRAIQLNKSNACLGQVRYALLFGRVCLFQSG